MPLSRKEFLKLAYDLFDEMHIPHRWEKICRKVFYCQFMKVKKVNLSLCLINCTLSRKDVWGSRSIAPTFLTSELDGGEWSASRPDRFTPGERDSGTYCIGGWVGLTGGLDAVK
jgi:hypothetical protein